MSKPLTIAAQVHAYPPDTNAGAEWMLHSMLRALVARGHTCNVYLATYAFSKAREAYEIDGVNVFPLWSRQPFGKAAPSADVLVSHLDFTQDTMNTAIAHRKPFVQVLHNTSSQTMMLASCYADLIVYNSEWQREHLGSDPRGIIVRPPVFADDYKTTPGSKVMLANLNEDKGGELFWELARRMPDVEFLAVKGSHGEQILDDLPNVELVDNGPHMREMYGKTKVVLMPSRYESWGRVATEAMCSGIPVIANPTPGLKENLGTAGTFIDRNKVDDWEAAIRKLLGDGRTYGAKSRAALKRSKELDPTNDLNLWCESVERIGNNDQSCAS